MQLYFTGKIKFIKLPEFSEHLLMAITLHGLTQHTLK